MDINRRQFAGGIAALGFLPQSAQSQVLDSYVPTSVIDAAFDMTSRKGMMKMLVDRGVRTVFRYYAYKDQPERNLPTKVLRPKEAKALWAAGINIGAVFQYNNDKIESITPQRGRADAEHALTYAANTIGQPYGSAIYFGVDGSWAGAEKLQGVASYFEAVNNAFARAGNPYRVGAYGSGTVLQFLLDRGLTELTWLALSRGWPGTQGFYNSGNWNLFQFSHHLQFGKNRVDGNVINPFNADIGDFSAQSVAEPQDFGKAILLKDQFFFSKRRKVPMYAKPNRSAAKLQDLTLAYNPIVLRNANGWLAVSLDGTNRIAGYVEAAGFTDSREMPSYK